MIRRTTARLLPVALTCLAVSALAVTTGLAPARPAGAVAPAAQTPWRYIVVSPIGMPPAETPGRKELVDVLVKEAFRGNRSRVGMSASQYDDAQDCVGQPCDVVTVKEVPQGFAILVDCKEDWERKQYGAAVIVKCGIDNRSICRAGISHNLAGTIRDHDTAVKHAMPGQ
jgi:hypothetical protein